MRIALVIDDLNSGGAQRQLCLLAQLLKSKGHDVELFKYHSDNFFRPMLDDAGVLIHEIRSNSYLGRAWKLRSAIRSFRCDVAIAFLSAPSFFLEIAGLPRRNFGVIVSERSGRVANVSWRDWFFLNSHRLADALVTNSHAMRTVVERTVPALQDRTQVIVNCVDTDYFRPVAVRAESPQTQFVVVARVSPAKNAIGLAKAVKLVRQERPELSFVVQWYGSTYFENGQPTEKSHLFLEVREQIQELQLEDVFQLKPQQPDPRPIYRKADALLLPSFFEGCSNVICEALACGLPVVTSDVCDNSVLVKDGVNGLLFDPLDHHSIAQAIIRFCDSDDRQRAQMGRASRQYAEEHLGKDRYVDEYLTLIQEVLRRRGMST